MFHKFISFRYVVNIWQMYVYQIETLYDYAIMVALLLSI